MKKYLVVMLLCMSAVSIAGELTLGAKSAMVVDVDSNTVLFEKNADDKRSIASITKLMSAIVTLDAALPLDEVITITQADVEATKLRGQPTSGSLPVGAKLTRAEVLHLTLMNSQNRAAAALARTYPGGMDKFVEAMNAKAKELNLVDTQYVDPTGLFNDNISTAQDLIILVQKAAEYPEIRDFSTATSFKRTVHYKKRTRTAVFGTTNRLVAKGWDIDVQKTGFIRKAGHCVVMLTTIDARRVAVVLLDTVSNRQRAVDAVAIRYWIENSKIASPATLAALDPYRRRAR